MHNNEVHELRSSKIEKVDNSIHITPGLAKDLARCNSFSMMNMSPVPRSYRYRYNTLHAVIPPSDNFLPQYKNPCWYANYTFPSYFKYVYPFKRRNLPLISDLKLLNHVFTNKDGEPVRTLQCLPYFHLVGFPKCGTTALMYYIKQHPEYAPSCGKELHWWGVTDITGNKVRDIASVLYYLKCFDDATSKIKQDPSVFVTGDGSTDTIYLKPFHANDDEDNLACETPLLIETIQPRTKYIIIMREPIDFMYSAFYDLCFNIAKKTPQTFHEMVVHHLRWWNSCTRNYSTLQCVYSKHRDNECKLLHTVVHPYIFVSIWLQVIPMDRFLFLKAEEFKANVTDVMRNVYDFLKLSPLSDQQLSNIVKVQHINEQKFLHTPGNTKFEMLQSTRGLLLKFYKPFNEKLVHLLNDSRFLWKDVYY